MANDVNVTPKENGNSLKVELPTQGSRKNSLNEPEVEPEPNGNSIMLKDLSEEPKSKLKCFDKNQEKQSSAPDGGWGWVVLAAAFFMRMIVTGIYVSFALYTTDFTKEFQISPSVMSWMISIYSAIYLLVAPVASLLAVRFGSRTVSFVALILAGIVYPSTYFYPTLWFNILTASVIVPFCNGLCNMCTNLVLTTYFEKRLSIAMGIFSCGSGVASFLITPFMAVVIDKCGWRLSKVIYSIFYVLAALSVLTYSPIVPKVVIEESGEENKEKDEMNIEKMENFFGSKDSNIYNFISLANITSTLPNTEDPKNYIASRRSLGVPKRVVDKCEVNMINVPLDALVGISVASNINIKSTVEISAVDNIEDATLQETGIVSEGQHPSRYVDLLKNPVFLLFLFSNLFSSMGYDTPFLYTKAKGLELGFTNLQATFLLTCLGIGNIIGRLVIGFLGSNKWISTYLLNMGCFILAGLFVLLSRFAFSYALMITYAIGFGIFVGGYVTIGQVILVQLLPLRDFSKGLSLMFVVQAIGLFAGAPISGAVFDATNSFNWPFMSCGFIILFGGLLLPWAYLFKGFRDSQRQL